jgi:hypothetical protein
MACGGDVVGTWKIDKVCYADSLVMGAGSSCPSATVEASGITVSGSTSFKADKTYATSTMIGGTIRLTMPPSCLTVNGITVTCAQLQQALAQSLGRANSPYDMATCSGSSSCTCTLHLKPQTQQESGTWSTSGNVLTTTAAGQRPESSDYCVKGTELDVTDTMSMPMGMTARAYYTAHRE